jgi:hypothetical protein
MSIVLNGTGGTISGVPGIVLQVVNATYATETNTSSGTYADSGLTASITPSSTSSKILVAVNLCGCLKDTGNTGLDSRLVRNSTALYVMSRGAAETGNTTKNDIGSISTSYLDSPATTSSTTYKVQIASTSGITQGRICQNNVTSTITLMEIAA